MKISIDVSQSVYKGTGSGRYVVELMRSLIRMKTADQFLLFASALHNREYFTSVFSSLPDNFDLRVFPLPPSALELLWNKLHFVSIDSFIGSTDIYHSSDWTQAPSNAKKVTTVHDMIPFMFPEHVHPRILRAHADRWKWIQKEVDHIIVDAQSTKNDIVRLLSIEPHHITVIPLGCDDRFFDVGSQKLSQLNSNQTDTTTSYYSNLTKALATYSLSQNKYVLSVGTMEPRKNLSRLVEAHKLLPAEVRKEFPLVIVGKKSWAPDLLIDDHIHITGYVEDNELPYLYAGAVCFVMPSLYEGFGLPVLEAMASATPVICSETSSLPEIGGDDVHYIQNSESVESIRLLLQHVLESDSDELQKISEVAYNRASRFTWQNTAEQTMKVYRGLV